MSNELAVITKKPFEERIKDKLKDSFADLVTDDELLELVKKGTEEIFFKERVKYDHSGYGSPREIKTPALIEQYLKEDLEPVVKEVVQEFVKENGEEIKSKVTDTLNAAPTEIIEKAINCCFRGAFDQFSIDIQNKLRNMVGDGSTY